MTTPYRQFTIGILLIITSINLLILVPVLPVFAEDATSTKAPTSTRTPVATLEPGQLPHAVTLTPTPTAEVTMSVPPTATSTLTTTPVTTISDPAQLPKPLSATPASCTKNAGDILSPLNRTLLDQSVANSMAAASLKFALNGILTVQANGESASLQVRGTGFATNLDDLTNFSYQVQLAVTETINGNARTINIEQRVVQGVLYLRGEEHATGRSTRWIGIRLSDLIKDTLGAVSPGLFPGFDLSSITSITDKIADNSGDLLELLKLTRYVTTVRLDSQQDTAHFQTIIALDCLLHSSTDLGNLLATLTRLGGIKLPAAVAKQVAIFIQPRLAHLVPTISLSVDTYIDANQRNVLRVALNFATTADLGVISGGKSQMADVLLNGTLAVSGYGSEVSIEAPADVLMLDSLKDIPSDVLITATP